MLEIGLVWFGLVWFVFFLCNIDECFEAKMLCLLAGWLAGLLAAVTHTCCNSREHKYRPTMSV
jgi:hypothetical protein